MATDQLDAVFGALADPTRRAILDPPHQGRGDRRRARRAVPRVAAGDLAAPQGARARGADLPHPAGDRPPQPPPGRAAARRPRCGSPDYREYWEAELRAARRAARGAAGAGNRPIATGRSDRKEHDMTELQVTAEPGVPQVLTSREFDAPRELVYPRVHRAGAARAVARAAEVHDDGRPLRPPRRRHVALRPRRRRRQRVRRSTASSTANPLPTASCRPSSSRARPATSRWTRSRSRSTTARPPSAPTRCSSRSRPATRWSTPAWPAA